LGVTGDCDSGCSGSIYGALLPVCGTHRHVAPDVSLHRIRTLDGSLKKLEAQLDEAVATARGGGRLLGKDRQGFGISRRGAQKGWEGVSADERTPA
jgi:hypothetical protein